MVMDAPAILGLAAGGPCSVWRSRQADRTGYASRKRDGFLKAGFLHALWLGFFWMTPTNDALGLSCLMRKFAAN